MIINIFCLLSILFMWNEFYYINNKNKLNLKFKEMELNSFNKMDVLFYLTRVLYWIWMIIGIWIIPVFFIPMIVLYLGRIPVYYISKRYYLLYDITVSLASVVFMFVVFCRIFID